MVVVSAGHVGAICVSGIVSSTADVLWIIVVRGMRGVGRVFALLLKKYWQGLLYHQQTSLFYLTLHHQYHLCISQIDMASK